MNDEDRRNEIVTLAVYPDTKDEWESAAQDDPDADSLSQLVRVAVNRYLHDRANGSSGEVSQEIHEQLTELNTQQRGYEGDYRFALIGATTPLDSRAWSAMGHVGNRLVFHYLPRKESPDEIAADVFEGREYGEQVVECQAEVTAFLRRVWEDYGGYGSVTWKSAASGEVRDGIAYLAHLVAHCRAPGEAGTREGEHRIMSSLRNIARGHALLCGRDELRMADVQLSSRLALSTMHKERRGIVRAILNPATPDPISSKDLKNHGATGSTRQTLRERMKLLERLGLGQVVEADNARDTKQFLLKDEFAWPDYLHFPTFG